MPRFESLTLALILPLALAACGEDEAEDTLVETAAGCLYRDFDVTIDEGPSAPLKLVGDLALNRINGTPQLEGSYVIPASDGSDTAELLIAVTGQLDGDDITLSFALPDGNTVHGTGTLPAEFDSCPTPVEGSAMGPMTDDRGHWLSVDGDTILFVSDPNQPSGKGSFKGGTCFCGFSSKTSCTSAGGTAAFCCACCGLGL